MTRMVIYVGASALYGVSNLVSVPPSDEGAFLSGIADFSASECP